VRWRQVAGLYLVLGALGALYWAGERPGTEDRPARHPARPRFLPLDARDLRELTIERGGRTIRSRRENGRWAIVDPEGTSIPPDLVAAFAEALTGAEEIERVAGEGADTAAFGLDDQAARVELRDGAGHPVVVTLGSTNANGTAVYARRAETRDVVLIGRNVRYYEDLLFQALPSGRVPASDGDAPVGG
jgi:hypothetical protein